MVGGEGKRRRMERCRRKRGEVASDVCGGEKNALLKWKIRAFSIIVGFFWWYDELLRKSEWSFWGFFLSKDWISFWSWFKQLWEAFILEELLNELLIFSRALWYFHIFSSFYYFLTKAQEILKSFFINRRAFKKIFMLFKRNFVILIINLNFPRLLFKFSHFLVGCLYNGKNMAFIGILL